MRRGAYSLRGRLVSEGIPSCRTAREKGSPSSVTTSGRCKWTKYEPASQANDRRECHDHRADRRDDLRTGACGEGLGEEKFERSRGAEGRAFHPCGAGGQGEGGA